jgi:hypothetical protein
VRATDRAAHERVAAGVVAWKTEAAVPAKSAEPVKPVRGTHRWHERSSFSVVLADDRRVGR